MDTCSRMDCTTLTCAAKMKSHFQRQYKIRERRTYLTGIYTDLSVRNARAHPLLV
jgi:hypothetical protein